MPSRPRRRRTAEHLDDRARSRPFDGSRWLDPRQVVVVAALVLLVIGGAATEVLSRSIDQTGRQVSGSSARSGPRSAISPRLHERDRPVTTTSRAGATATGLERTPPPLAGDRRRADRLEHVDQVPGLGGDAEGREGADGALRGRPGEGPRHRLGVAPAHRPVARARRRAQGAARRPARGPQGRRRAGGALRLRRPGRAGDARPRRELLGSLLDTGSMVALAMLVAGAVAALRRARQTVLDRSERSEVAALASFETRFGERSA